jgi:lipopolysaccharide export system permease protein
VSLGPDIPRLAFAPDAPQTRGDEYGGSSDPEFEAGRQLARLSRYLLGLFWSEAMALFAVAAFLLFLIQCLRLFDDLAQKGQSLVTMLGQALLGMPALGIGFLYVCLGIGLGRALRTLQGNGELQIMHVNALLPALLRAILVYILTGAALLLLLAHIVTPLSQRALGDWSAQIAADVVSRSMVPHKIVALSNGVSVTMDARDASGDIKGFFADDNRNPQARRTYFAQTAIITRDSEGYVVRMQDGAIQQFNDGAHMSEFRFGRYDLNLDELTGKPSLSGGTEQTSIALVSEALAARVWPPEVTAELLRRSVEALRVIAICLLVTALAMFPSGDRRPAGVPMEFLVLGAAFVERGFGTFAPLPGPLAQASGPLLLAFAALTVLAVRLRIFSPLLKAGAT